ncbi:hypothetical protein [Dictyobacter arantiisoli]|uniref:hypothetical protein n=1 Tax=Dictyobacter arantiisoli TaxID=2014874 RepID=UPI001F1C66F5|nr:hypothetical protein [Dictyobacter arantiisoli]
MPTASGGQTLGGYFGLIRDHLDDIHRQHLTSRSLGIVTGAFSQLQKPHGQRRQKSQQRSQAFIALDLTCFNVAAGFEALMIILHNPTDANQSTRSQACSSLLTATEVTNIHSSPS